MTTKSVLLLADAGSHHTFRWAGALAARGWEVHVASLRGGEIPAAQVHVLEVPGLSKLAYLGAAGEVRALARRVAPKILHAHYATSYGLLGALSGRRPFMVSVWGSDVFDFPTRSPLHRALLAWNLRAASVITATSHALAGATRRLVPGREVSVVPFGVDLECFRAGEEPEIPTIGCLKALEPTYGHEFLLEAFARVVRDRGDRPLRLRVGGTGPLEAALRRQAGDLGVSDRVDFRGPLAVQELPDFYRSLTVFAMPSLSESFGVVAVEAAACGLPVVATDVGGIPEVVLNGATGLLVPPRDPGALAAALGRLLDDPALRREMGAAGRQHVAAAYDWNANVSAMERLYEDVAGRQGLHDARRGLPGAE